MVEEFYNASTDNIDRAEAPSINASTGISNFARPKTNTSKITQGELFKRYLGQQKKMKPQLTPQQYRVVGINIRKQDTRLRQARAKQGIVGGFLGLKRRTTGKTSIQDRIKVMKYQNMLEKARLRNQIERMKLNKKAQSLQRQGILKQAIAQPMMRRPIYNDYPAYSTPEIIGDLDSGFNADINPAKNDMWGDESFFGGENYYDEDYYGNEFDNDPLLHLNLKPRSGVSPLLW